MLFLLFFTLIATSQVTSQVNVVTSDSRVVTSHVNRTSTITFVKELKNVTKEVGEGLKLR